MGGKKREKITYIDDGRTIADMSDVRGGLPRSGRSPYTPRSSFKEQWRTYWGAVKLMLKPLLVVVIGLLGIYGIIYLIFQAI